MNMKCLSIRQPWAWLIVNGLKDIENRDWPTKIRGALLIHASKTIDKEAYAWLKEHFPKIHECVPPANEIRTGGIVGRVDLVDCVQDSDSPWFFGEYGFVLENAKTIPFIECKGSLGIFTVDYAGFGDEEDIGFNPTAHEQAK